MKTLSKVVSFAVLSGSTFSRNAMAAYPSSIQNFVVRVSGSGVPTVNTEFQWTVAEQIPTGFSVVCVQNGWDASQMWTRLNGNRPWLCSMTNDAYIYWNGGDGHWWIDEPCGLGVFIAASNDQSKPPSSGWKALKHEYEPLPVIQIKVQ